MPDPFPGTVDELRQAAAAAVDALPCVARLEPTLTNALRRLHHATLGRVAASQQAVYSAADGIRLSRRGNLVDIHVDVTATTVQPADLTAQHVRDTLRAAINERQLTPGEITVTVLRIKPG